MIPGQRGLATTAQLREAGWSTAAMRHLAATRGRRVAWGVLAHHRGALGDDDWLVAGWLWAGSDAVLTGARALELRGLDVGRTPPPRFLVPGSRRTRVGPRGARTVRTRRLPRGVLRRDIPVAPLERALVDAGTFHELAQRDLRALALSTLQAGLTTADRLEDELEDARPYGGRPLRDAVQAFRDGAWSLPEELLADAVRRCPELPPMLANPTLRTPDGELIGRPDGWFPDAGVAVQVHSRAHHSGLDPDGQDRWVATVERDNEYQRHGIVVVPLTPATLERDAAGFVASLVETVRAHGGRPPLDVVTG